MRLIIIFIILFVLCIIAVFLPRIICMFKEHRQGIKYENFEKVKFCKRCGKVFNKENLTTKFRKLWQQ